MTIEPLPETILVTQEVPISHESLACPGSRTEAMKTATLGMTATAAAFGRVLVDGTVCLESETDSVDRAYVVLRYSAFTVAR